MRMYSMLLDFDGMNYVADVQFSSYSINFTVHQIIGLNGKRVAYVVALHAFYGHDI